MMISHGSHSHLKKQRLFLQFLLSVHLMYSLLFKSRQLLDQLMIISCRSQFCPMVQVANKKKINMDEDGIAHEGRLKEQQTPLAQLPGNL